MCTGELNLLFILDLKWKRGRKYFNGYQSENLTRLSLWIGRENLHSSLPNFATCYSYTVKVRNSEVSFTFLFCLTREVLSTVSWLFLASFFHLPLHSAGMSGPYIFLLQERQPLPWQQCSIFLDKSL